jgi:hypothetical protein
MPSVAPPPTSVAAITLSVYRAPSCTKVFGVSDHNLPNLPVILGPNIIGTSAYCYCWGAGVVSTGALKDSKMSNKASMVSGHNPEAYELLAIDFNAKNSNQIYHTDSTVQPRSLVFNYIIKY